MRPFLFVMQDNARFMREAGHPYPLASLLPDLNPIKTFCEKLKHFIQSKYLSLSSGERKSRGELRLIVKEAWNSMPFDYVVKLLEARQC